MFGYVRANKPEMRLREYEYYRGVYCGLCRALGKCGGQCARLTLSYDFAFMALVRMSIDGTSPKFKPRRCAVHPTKKRAMAEINDTLELCAASSILLSYHKIRDDINDERGAKKLRARLAMPFFKGMRRKASRRYSSLEEHISLGLERLSQYEKDNSEPSIDRPAEIFGDLLADIMAHGLEGSRERIARKIGKHVGKWIYIVDAADDFAEDVKNSRFNPIYQVCKSPTIPDNLRSALINALTYELMEAEKAFDLIDHPDKDVKEIISNIIYLGMPTEAKRVLAEPERKESE